MQKSEKANAIILAVMMVFLLSQPFHKLDSNLAFMIFPWLLFLPFVGGAKADVIKSMNWEMVLFAAGCMSIGTVASSFGFGQLMSQYMTPILMATGGNLFVVFGAVFGVVFFLNFIMTPMAIWALVSEPMIQIALTMNFNPLPFMYTLVHSAEAIILPYEYIPYLIVYSFGMISMADFIKMSLVRCAIYITGFMVLLIPYWYVIGIIH